MIFKGLTAAVAALALTATPVMAAANSSPQPVAEVVSGDDSALVGLTGAGAIFAALIGAAWIVAVILIITDDEDNSPVSP